MSTIFGHRKARLRQLEEYIMVIDAKLEELLEQIFHLKGQPPQEDESREK